MPVRRGQLTTTEPLPVLAFRALVRTFGQVERVMQPYFARYGISGSQWGVLRNLYCAGTAGSGLRVSSLSDQLLIRPPSVTGVVDRLERAGLVSRHSDPSDQRAVHVALTTAGRRLVERILTGHERQIESILAVLSRSDQREFHRLLTRLGEHLDALSASRPSLEFEP